jgi:protein SCO1/2
MKNWRIWLSAAFTIIVGALAYFIFSSLDSNPPYEGAEMSGEAADFRLTDQNGSVINLSDFRGKVVVLTFMDSKCKDTCPLTAAQLRDAYRQFNRNESNRVAFIGVNVNIEANTVVDVYEITKTWRLEEIPSWHFLTGSRQDLESIWQDYGIAAIPNPDGNEIMHTPGVFLIDPSGQKRWYISTPFSELRDTELALPLNELLVKHVREILREN